MNELTKTIPSGGEREKGKRGLSLPVRVLLGALLGVLLGLLVGDYTRVLEPVGKAYVQFLAMCVFPYLIASLLHGLGRMDPATAVRLFARSWFVFVLGWVTVLAAMMLLALAFPFSGKPAVILPANSGGEIDIVSILVPGNFFAALTRNSVPAVVVFAVPDFEGRGDTAQIVDMPVQALGDAEMMAQPRAQAAGAERRADVDITTCRRSQRAESADGDTATSFNRQQ